MGVDFIRQRAKPFRRGWDEHRRSLCERTLFSEDPVTLPRTALAKAAGAVERDAVILVKVEASGLLTGYRELTPVLEFVKPPPDLVELISRSGGLSEGRVVSVLDENVVEVEIC